eukprot:NODE_20_length_39102_cov_0.325513.p16 type:complete len:171 gc:universal NODE_20_length_39102_cov_0.325513:10678-11190(+)
MALSTLQISNSELCLVSKHGYVYDVGIYLDCPVLGNVLKKYMGKDISHIFQKDGNIKKHYDKYTGELCEMIEGMSLDLVGVEKWWRKIAPVDKLSANEFYLKLFNTLTGQSEIKLVCIEDTLGFILKDYDLTKLSVKYGNKHMDLGATLESNGVISQFSLPTIYMVFVPE